MSEATLNDDGVSVKGCNLIYAPRGQAGEYSALAANPYRGCGHKCAYCLSPDTLIQMADGRSLRLEHVNIGDELIGVVKRDEHRRSWNYSYAPSRVLAKINTRKAAIRVTLASGQSVVCSADHRWLTNRGWKFTRNLTLNNEIRTFSVPVETPVETEQYRRGYLAGMIRGDATLKRYDYSGRHQRSCKKSPQKTDILHQFRLALKDDDALTRSADYLQQFGVTTKRFPFSSSAVAPMQAIRANSKAAFGAVTSLIETKTEQEWQRGWLSGIFDAEGGATPSVRIHNTDPDILALTDTAMAAFGFKSTRDVERENGCAAVRLLGGLPEVARFFNLTSPAISRKFPAVGSAMRGSSRVVSIEPLGYEIEMLDITTSTENFIANGMVSHNCYVPDVLRMSRADFDEGAVPRDNYLPLLRKEARKYQSLGVSDQVMLSFTTDPYHPTDNTLSPGCSARCRRRPHWP